MDTEQLAEISRQDFLINSSFCGVFARNRLPASLQNNSIYYVNDQDDSKSGNHWFLISSKGEKSVQFMCSFGSKPKHAGIIHSLQSLGKPVVYNQKRLQSFESGVCGYHCIFFAFHLCRDFTMDQIIDKYYSDTGYSNTGVGSDSGGKGSGSGIVGIDAAAAAEAAYLRNDLRVFHFIKTVFGLKEEFPLAIDV